MAVSLPSDLILDVMRNADPGRLSAATNKLQVIGGGDATTEFAHLLEGAEASSAQQEEASLSAAAGPAAFTRHMGTPEPLVEFERMVLRNLLESLLPDSGSGAFGAGPSAGVWRSLAADQLAGVYAGSGGAGIADALSASGEGKAPDTGLQWPYFSSGKIEAFAG